MFVIFFLLLYVEIPSGKFDFIREQSVQLNVKGELCEMFLFRVSRLHNEEALDEIIAINKNCKFYQDKVNFPVCAAYPVAARGKMLAVYPFSKNPVCIYIHVCYFFKLKFYVYIYI